MAKLISSRNAERVCSHGGGYCSAAMVSPSEYPVEKFYRDAKIGQIYEGISNACSCRRLRNWSWASRRRSQTHQQIV